MRQAIHSTRAIRRIHACAGFTLLEVLVSILVLSFGMLGLAGLQTASLRVNREASLQSSAVQFAREYSEFMRNNPGISSKAGNPYLFSETEQEGAGNSGSNQASTGTNCRSQACTATQLAAWEVQEWKARLFAALPSAHIVICHDTSPYSASGLPQWECSPSSSDFAVSIKIGWRQSVMQNNGEATLQSAKDKPPGVVQVFVTGGTGT